jgi:hypothetical protein
MFRQGDRERAASYPISLLMDRRKTGITKSQVKHYYAYKLYHPLPLTCTSGC